jgi:biopolymer transport protein ExbD
MPTWSVRKEGSAEVYQFSTPEQVHQALRDGHFAPTDEVRGPGESAWQSFEQHPLFAEAVVEYEPPVGEGPDETHLDMNPLIDVCLVLLIFFILNITYASLERAIEVPEDSAEDKGMPEVQLKDLQDKVFVVTAKMEGDKPVIRIGVVNSLKEVPLERLYKEMEQLINTTGRKEMVMDIDEYVPWGIETAILDAAKGNKIHNIINNQRNK